VFRKVRGGQGGVLISLVARRHGKTPAGMEEGGGRGVGDQGTEMRLIEPPIKNKGLRPSEEVAPCWGGG